MRTKREVPKMLIRSISWGILLVLVAAVVVPAQLATGKLAETNRDPKSKFFDAARLLEDIKYLSSDEMEGRSADRPSMRLVRDYVERRFRESGIESINGSFKQEFPITRRNAAPVSGINFVGLIKGKKHADKYIIVTAHYDHDGIKNGEIYNGADDNASGTAALFAIASYFKSNQPDHSLIFVAFDAEEKGLVGARHFVANLPVAKGSIMVNVNMDMISRSDKGELYAVGTYHYPQLKPVIDAASKKSNIKLLTGHDDPRLGRDDWTSQSDHAAFHREKIPFIYFGVEDHKDYHKPTDDFAKIQPEFYVRAVETIIDALRQVDSSRSPVDG
ncbi:MAG: M28 family peptidase [Pyrinomonadaceae bacterium]